MPKYLDTYRPKRVNTLKQKCFDSFFKENVKREYWGILAQKVMHEDLVKFKTFLNIANFVVSFFRPKIC